VDIPSLHTPYNHLCIGLAIEFLTRHFNTKIDITEIMVDCSTARVASQKINMREINLREGILVAAYDYGRAIAVQQEDMGLWMCGEEKGFERQIDVRIGRVRQYRCFQTLWQEKRHCIERRRPGIRADAVYL
jgi:predicted DNA repair protein MutK